MLHVFIADDDEQVRFGLRTLLSLTGNVEIVGEADRIDRLVSGTLLSQPDVVLLDWELPGRGRSQLVRDPTWRCQPSEDHRTEHTCGPGTARSGGRRRSVYLQSRSAETPFDTLAGAGQHGCRVPSTNGLSNHHCDPGVLAEAGPADTLAWRSAGRRRMSSLPGVSSQVKDWIGRGSRPRIPALIYFL